MLVPILKSQEKSSIKPLFTSKTMILSKSSFKCKINFLNNCSRNSTIKSKINSLNKYSIKSLWDRFYLRKEILKVGHRCPLEMILVSRESRVGTLLPSRFRNSAHFHGMNFFWRVFVWNSNTVGQSLLSREQNSISKTQQKTSYFFTASQLTPQQQTNSRYTLGHFRGPTAWILLSIFKICISCKGFSFKFSFKSSIKTTIISHNKTTNKSWMKC